MSITITELREILNKNTTPRTAQKITTAVKLYISNRDMAENNLKALFKSLNDHSK